MDASWQSSTRKARCLHARPCARLHRSAARQKCAPRAATAEWFFRLRVLRLHYASDAARVLQHCVARRTAIQTIADLLRTHRVSAVRRPHRVGLPQERLASAPTGGLGR